MPCKKNRASKKLIIAIERQQESREREKMKKKQQNTKYMDCMEEEKKNIMKPNAKESNQIKRFANELPRVLNIVIPTITGATLSKSILSGSQQTNRRWAPIFIIHAYRKCEIPNDKQLIQQIFRFGMVVETANAESVESNEKKTIKKTKPNQMRKRYNKNKKK